MAAKQLYRFLDRTGYQGLQGDAQRLWFFCPREQEALNSYIVCNTIPRLASESHAVEVREQWKLNPNGAHHEL